MTEQKLNREAPARPSAKHRDQMAANERAKRRGKTTPSKSKKTPVERPEWATIAGEELTVSDRAMRQLAAAQEWACAGCGQSLGGGSAVLALADAQNDEETDHSHEHHLIADGIPVLAHADCLDDGQIAGKLSDVARLARDAKGDDGADADAAAGARAGAVEHYLKTIQRNIEKLKRLVDHHGS